MSALTIEAYLPNNIYKQSGIRFGERENISDFSEADSIENFIDESREAIVVEDNSVVFDPNVMKVGQYYLAVVNGEPYLYRKANEEEVEVYGLAPEA